MLCWWGIQNSSNRSLITPVYVTVCVCECVPSCQWRVSQVCVTSVCVFVVVCVHVQEESITSSGHDNSLFAWAVKRKNGVSAMLKTQYRMHEDIAKFPNESFYDGELKTGESVKERVSPWNENLTNLAAFQKPYRMWDTSAKANPGSTANRYRDQQPTDTQSRFNLGEVDVVVGLLGDLDKAVRQANSRKWTVFVLSPYKAQVGCCFATCRRHRVCVVAIGPRVCACWCVCVFLHRSRCF